MNFSLTALLFLLVIGKSSSIIYPINTPEQKKQNFQNGIVNIPRDSLLEKVKKYIKSIHSSDFTNADIIIEIEPSVQLDFEVDTNVMQPKKSNWDFFNTFGRMGEHIYKFVPEADKKNKIQINKPKPLDAAETIKKVNKDIEGNKRLVQQQQQRKKYENEIQSIKSAYEKQIMEIKIKQKKDREENQSKFEKMEAISKLEYEKKINQMTYQMELKISANEKMLEENRNLFMDKKRHEKSEAEIKRRRITIYICSFLVLALLLNMAIKFIRYKLASYLESRNSDPSESDKLLVSIEMD